VAVIAVAVSYLRHVGLSEMQRFIVSILLVCLGSAALRAAEPSRPLYENGAAVVAFGVGGPLSEAAALEVDRVVRVVPATRTAVRSVPSSEKRGWVGRHGALLGSLVGFGVGCAAGASRVGGSQDTFINALDESACPVVGGIGAGIGAIVGWSLSKR
jgi:hypothetical protein